MVQQCGAAAVSRRARGASGEAACAAVGVRYRAVVGGSLILPIMGWAHPNQQKMLVITYAQTPPGKSRHFR